ncbi:MAG TPA: hypothetical protein VHC22_02495 [Pirellulales bacterium]|nr:hypothetical protein [Pirellulales bacterium]
MNNRAVREFVVLVVAAGALCNASCNRNPHDLYPVSGNVTYNGSPAAGAAVFFYRRGADPANDQTVMGIVQGDGSFELVCGPFGKGAPPGDYDVGVEWKPVVGQSNGNPQRGPDRFGGRYSDPHRSTLHAVVAARANHLPPFELTD